MKPSLSLHAALLAALFAMAGSAHADRPRDGSWRDRDDNPPGPRGGHGTNWENPPGARGGRGASPDHRYWRHDGKRYRFNEVRGGYYYSERYGYWHPRYGLWNSRGRCWIDFDNNPPGPRGGRGTNWENPPGWRGGPGASPDRFGGCR